MLKNVTKYMARVYESLHALWLSSHLQSQTSFQFFPKIMNVYGLLKQVQKLH